jgi:hypothetical protein
MRFWKRTIDNYIAAVGIGNLGEEVTESEYNDILAAIYSEPIAADGFGYRLRKDYTWEAYELPEAEETEEISDTEALEILLGGAV